ncbi:beta-N-acetylglucosaminidase [Corynebacterium lizhenjunii]|uniref:beta-N-acetylglucosaminidase n=1 Tax=Corynebacterium lizhenjunii TaxID=2709394 RepID=UPI001F199608|nr:beta-N-acetylglucosaminidase [Corynebacterium lizhenjunii]
MRRHAHRFKTARHGVALATVAVATVGLVACGSDESAPESADTASSAPVTTTSTVAATQTSSTEATTSASAESSASATSSESEPAAAGASAETSEGASSQASSSEAPGEFMAESVADAYEIFSPLAPRSLFEKFSSCDSAGLKGSYNCSGHKVGQFQFFDSESKAAQSTQVLEELSSSRLLYNDGDRLVGWSTLGTTAVLTVVDNTEGLVMQQMISTDQEDPKAKITELELLP